MIVKRTSKLPDCSPQDHCGKKAIPLAVDEAALDRCSRTFRAMGDPGRLRLLARLAHGPACVGELAEAERESVTTISQRLRVLRADDIVRRTRDGKHVVYALADEHMFTLVSDGLAHAAEPMPVHTSVAKANKP